MPAVDKASELADGSTREDTGEGLHLPRRDEDGLVDRAGTVVREDESIGTSLPGVDKFGMASSWML